VQVGQGCSLEMESYAVDMAVSGNEALDLIKNNIY
jgi:hypothetical protein